MPLDNGKEELKSFSKIYIHFLCVIMRVKNNFFSPNMRGKKLKWNLKHVGLIPGRTFQYHVNIHVVKLHELNLSLFLFFLIIFRGIIIFFISHIHVVFNVVRSMLLLLLHVDRTYIETTTREKKITRNSLVKLITLN